VLYTIGWANHSQIRPPCPSRIADILATKRAPKTNWVDGADASGWIACPHCKPDLGQIYLPKRVTGDFPFTDVLAEPGLYVADFNPQGAARVRATNGDWLGIKPAEFIWTSPIPPYDRWCKGKGGLHR
jgi:hypothetical protein